MRVAHYLTRGQSGLFYFRMRVPADLRAALGCVVIKRATGTRCPRAALACAVAWAGGYARAFYELRQGDGMTKPPSIADIVAGFQRGEVRTYTFEHPSGFKLTANDADDHRRAMEALEKIGPLSALLPHTPAAPVASSKPMDMDEAVRMWALTLPAATPGERKGSKAMASKVRAFYDWKRLRVKASFLVSAVSRTDFAEYFVYNKSLTTKRGKPPAPRYIENKFLVLAGFLDWAKTSGYLYFPTDENPARGHAQVAKRERKRRAKTHGWQAFNTEQVKCIFDPDSFATMEAEAARWITVMALYTGARSNELAHLELEDCYEFAGQPLLDFNFLGPHKSLKTDASERKTPVHPDLIALGLWKRVARLRAAGEVKLFPGLNYEAENGPANGAQRAFSRYLQRLDIQARGKGRVGLHSFRDTAIQTMKLAGVREEYRREYCGHEQGESDDHHDAYGIDLLPAGLAKQCHPALAFGLDLKALGKLLD